MVDLAKIRRKAKKKEEKGTEPVPPVVEGGAAGFSLPAEAAAATPEPLPPTANRQPPTEPNKLDRFKEQAGGRRESQSIQQEDAAPQNQLELLTFIIAGEQYAVDIERIVEIVTPRAITRIPNADRSVIGIMSLRGTIVTLVDVRGKLRHPPSGAVTDDTRVVVIDFQNEIVGFTVDRVLRVVKTTAGEIEPHPVVHAAELDESIRGVFRVSGALTILLDLDKLLDHRALAARTA